jgi:NTE family protein
MKIGLVLSGGGSRGVSHLGVVKALYENGIRPDIISGTSAGALVGAMLAYGYAPDEVLDISLKTNFLRYIRPAFRGGGLLRIGRIEGLCYTYIPENTFEALKIPLVVNATDICAGETVYYRTGELARPVLGSCCLPGLFEPMEYQGRQLVDGGVLNNLPVEPIEQEVDFLIGVHCNPFPIKNNVVRTSEVLMRSLIMAVHSRSRERFLRCNLLIEPPQLCGYQVFERRKAREMFSLGYEYTMQLLEESPIMV